MAKTKDKNIQTVKKPIGYIAQRFGNGKYTKQYKSMGTTTRRFLL